MEAQPEAGCEVAIGYEKRTRVHTRWIRALLGLAFVAAMLIAIGVGQPATAQNDRRDAPVASEAPVALFTNTLTVGQIRSDSGYISGEVVTTLPTTGIGPSDPDKRVTHWLFVIGAMFFGIANFWLAGRKLAALKTANVERNC
jgi:hypothetical protein